MAPSCCKDFIYVVCCFLGDEYLDEIDAYNATKNMESQKLCPKKPTIQNSKNLLRKTQSCCFPNSSPKTTTEPKKQKRKGLNWIIGDDYLTHDD